MRTTEEQIKALAELDGWKFTRVEKGPYNQAGYRVWQNGVECGGFDDSQKLEYTMRIFGIPNYRTSYDAIIPLIQKWSKVTPHHKQEFVSELTDILGMSGCDLTTFCYIVSTPAQLCEALLRATGKWKDKQ
jgi:hypothetical protein